MYFYIDAGGPYIITQSVTHLMVQTFLCQMCTLEMCGMVFTVPQVNTSLPNDPH